MPVPSLVVIGGGGDVGRGIVAAATDRGWAVTIVGRDRARLDSVVEEFATVAAVAGDVSSAAGVERIVAAIDFASVNAVVMSVNAPLEPAPLLGAPLSDVAGHVCRQYEAHLLAASGLIPRLSAGSVYVGIGGGMADVTYPGMGAASIVQAGLRAAYRHLAKESRAHGVAVRELIVHSMVSGRSNRATADPSWIAAEQVGESVCALIADPTGPRDPIVDLRPS